MVGPSGAGKTTLFDLAQRFYDPVQGRVLIDGVDIRSCSLRDLRDQIGFVPQDCVLFAGSVLDNLRYGAADADEAAVAEALAAAGALAFVDSFPDRACDPCRRRRCWVVRRPASAPRDRACADQKAPAAAARRSDQRARRAKRGSHSCNRTRIAGTHHRADHRAPAIHGDRGGPHRRARRRSRCCARCRTSSCSARVRSIASMRRFSSRRLDANGNVHPLSGARFGRVLVADII